MKKLTTAMMLSLCSMNLLADQCPTVYKTDHYITRQPNTYYLSSRDISEGWTVYDSTEHLNNDALQQWDPNATMTVSFGYVPMDNGDHVIHYIYNIVCKNDSANISLKKQINDDAHRQNWHTHGSNWDVKSLESFYVNCHTLAKNPKDCQFEQGDYDKYDDGYDDAYFNKYFNKYDDEYDD